MKVPELPYIFRESNEQMPNDFDNMVPSFSNGQSFGALHSAPDLHEGPDYRLPHLANQSIDYI